MQIRPLSAALFIACASTAFAATERPQDRWTLSDIYPDVRAWNGDVAKTEAELKQLAACRGHLGESARRFKQCLDLQYGVLKRLSRLGVYSGELEAEDTGKQESQALNQKA